MYALLKRIDILSNYISAVKKGENKKVQVTEQPKIYQLGLSSPFFAAETFFWIDTSYTENTMRNHRNACSNTYC